ncbi:MAG: type II toxin-antitoxin system RelE/ParE family toxin [Caulobacteraceae bacterium]
MARLEAFLAIKNQRAALAATDALLAAVRSLGDFPERGRPGKGAGRRELVVKYGRDAYVVRYRVTIDAVVVTRIFHGRENRP